MVAYNFPANPAQGDTYTSPDGKLTYGYNGFAWDMKAKAAAVQRPELINFTPYLVEAGAPDVEIFITGDLLTPMTQVIAIPDRGVGTEFIVPSTFISLTEISATFPTNTVTRDNIHDIYLETDGLRSQRMRQLVVAMAPTHDYLDPASVAAGGPDFNLLVYTSGAQFYTSNSGTISTKVSWDGVDMAVSVMNPGHLVFNNITPDAVPGTHEVTVRIEQFPDDSIQIPSRDQPLIFTYT